MLADLDEGTFVVPDLSTTLAVYVEQVWFHALQVKQLRASTLESYRRNLDTGGREASVAEIARLFIEDVFRLSPPRGLVVKGRIEGVFDAGSQVELVRITDGQRVRCRVGDVYVLDDSTDHASLGLEELPPDVSPTPGDVLEAAPQS